MIGLNSFKILGTEVVDPSEYDDAILLAPMESSSFDPNKHIEALEREENTILYVLRAIRRHLALNDCPVVSDFIKDVGIYKDNKDLKLTLFQRLFFSTPRDCIAYYLRNSRWQAYDLISNLDKFSPAEEDLQESYLLQNFIIEQFSIIPKAALKRHFFQYARSIPKPIHPALWLMGWIYVVGGLLYILYFVLLWGSVNDGVSLDAWGTNFALETLHACFVTSTLRLLIFNVIAIEILRYRIVEIYQGTLSMAEDVYRDQEVKQPEREGSRLIQLFSPSCIAARWAKGQNLVLGRVLRSLTDDDVAVMREQYKTQGRRGESEVNAINDNGEEKVDVVIPARYIGRKTFSTFLSANLDADDFFVI